MPVMQSAFVLLCQHTTTSFVRQTTSRRVQVTTRTKYSSRLQYKQACSIARGFVQPRCNPSPAAVPPRFQSRHLCFVEHVHIFNLPFALRFSSLVMPCTTVTHTVATPSVRLDAQHPLVKSMHTFWYWHTRVRLNETARLVVNFSRKFSHNAVDHQCLEHASYQHANPTGQHDLNFCKTQTDIAARSTWNFDISDKSCFVRRILKSVCSLQKKKHSSSGKEGR